MPLHDQFTPFCTRPFFTAAFRLPAAYRYSEPLHFQLLHLDPVLHKLPFLGEPWRPQIPALNMFSAIWRRRVKPALSLRANDAESSIQSLLLETLWSHFRSSCLDRSTSQLWDYIDRSSFETMMSGQPDSRLFNRFGLPIFQIVTLFAYERVIHS
jgi:asparagine synthase (glutamine-hydrolysing)